MVIDDEKQAFARRLNLALDAHNVVPKHKGRQEVVGEMFDVSQKGARKWLEGESIPMTKRIAIIAKELNVRGEWLLTGMGPMRPPPSAISETGKALYLTADQSKLLDGFDGLTKAQQQEILAKIQEQKRHNQALLAELASKSLKGDCEIGKDQDPRR